MARATSSKSCPGFLGIPILKGVVWQLLAFIGPAIQQLYNIIAGKTSEQARESNLRLPRGWGSNRRLPREVAKTKYLSKELIPGPLDGNSDALPIRLSVSIPYLHE